MIWAWIVIVLFCLLSGKLFERYVSTPFALFTSFFGIFFFGFGLICIGSYCGALAFMRQEYLQASVNLIPIAIGIFCVLMTVKPLVNLIGGWLKEKRA